MNDSRTILSNSEPVNRVETGSRENGKSGSRGAREQFPAASLWQENREQRTENRGQGDKVTR
jgi:hypothetical protein